MPIVIDLAKSSGIETSGVSASTVDLNAISSEERQRILDEVIDPNRRLVIQFDSEEMKQILEEKHWPMDKIEKFLKFNPNGKAFISIVSIWPAISFQGFNPRFPKAITHIDYIDPKEFCNSVLRLFEAGKEK